MAFTTLEAVIAQLQTYALALGLKDTPPLPFTANNFVGPFAQSICRKIDWEGGNPAGEMRGLTTFATQIHVTRHDAPMRDYTAVMHFGLDFPAVLWANPTLADNVANLMVVRCVFSQLEYAGVPTIGWDIEVDCKLRAEL